MNLNLKRSITVVIAAPAAVLTAVGGGILAGDAVASHVSAYHATPATDACMARVIDYVMTSTPEYPDDIAPMALARCHVRVIVDTHEPDEVNVHIIGASH